MDFNQELLPYLICLGPLVITVLGFVLLAIVTDGDARRTYLRVPPNRENEPFDKQMDAVTPAGIPVTILPPDAASTTKAAPAPLTSSPPPATDGPDDLTKIEGIGPKMAQALIAAGLDTFEKVAAASIADFQAAILAAKMNFAPSAESWAEQAGYAARGDWHGLSALQDTLISGRYPSSNS